MKQNERKQKREKKYLKILILVGFFEVPSSNQLYVNSLNLHEIKSEILLDCKGDFQLNGSMVIGPVEHKTNIRFLNYG